MSHSHFTDVCFTCTSEDLTRVFQKKLRADVYVMLGNNELLYKRYPTIGHICCIHAGLTRYVPVCLILYYCLSNVYFPQIFLIVICCRAQVLV